MNIIKGGKLLWKTNDKALLYEEATEAYKNIEEVISILEDYGVIEVIARMKPEVTYKC